MQNGSKLLEALAEAGPDDLRAVEERIAACKAEQASMEAAAKLLRAKLGVRAEALPKPSPKGVRASSEQMEAWRKAAAQHLARFGAKTRPDLASALGVPLTRMLRALEHPWFVNEGTLWRVTPEGRQAA